MSYKVLVIGDSFARYDETQTHWVRQWLLPYGGTTIHMGFGGNNVVNIVNEFENKYADNNDWNFDGVIFQIPDLLRVEGIPIKIEQPSNPSILLDYYDAILSNPKLIDDTLNGNNIIHPSLSAESNNLFRYYWLENMQLFFYLAMLDKESESYQKFAARKDPRDINILQSAHQLYTSISPRWLIRANYHALKYFNLLLASRNKPVCFVFNPGVDVKTMEYFTQYINGLSNIWHMNINSENVGNNHVSLDSAVKCAQLWDIHNKNTEIFPV